MSIVLETIKPVAEKSNPGSPGGNIYLINNNMELKEIRIIKSDDRGIIYNCGKSSFISRKKGTISANHAHEDPEIVYLVKGEVELTIGDETQIVKAPIMFKTDSNVYHKLIALTDIELVIDREEE